MADYDVFNGDADGICSLIQLRLEFPKDSIPVTGVKRDIELLKNIKVQEGDCITVLDISMEKNIAPLKEALNSGAAVFYADHHRSGDIPKNSKLEALIDLSPDTCTALIIDKYLSGKYKAWAITAAFGDNLKKEARFFAEENSFSEDEISLMDQLGTYINYNGYGESLDDLHYPPAELYKIMKSYGTPFEFIEKEKLVFETLKHGYEEDIRSANSLEAEFENEIAAMYILPDKKWARRVSGVFSNELAIRNPDRAHAVLTEKKSGDYLVSIRAPKTKMHGASDIAAKFPGGGGRAAAAGINNLPKSSLSKLFQELLKYYAH